MYAWKAKETCSIQIKTMMLKALIILLIFNAISLNAKTISDTALIADEYKGVYRTYDFDAQRENVPAPKGYKVFYLTHYGRHGSRYINRECEYDTLNVILHREQLTPYGQKVRDKFDEYYPLLKGRATDLTEVGKQQHRRLARRMVEDYPELFGRGSTILASSSDIPRCLLSMYFFLDELRQNRKSLDISADFRSSDVPLFRAPQLHFFPINEYLKEHFDPTSLFERIFSDPLAAAEGTEPCLFAQTLYYYICHLEGAGIQDIFWDSVLTQSEIRTLHKIECEKFSYNRGALCPVNQTVAAPTLQEIITTAEKDIESGKPIVRLRFGHDTMLMCLMSLIAVPPFDGLRYDCSNVPMGSNVRFVFARNKENDILVKIQYNESDVMGWTPWENFRKACLELIAWDPQKRTFKEKNSEYNPMLIAHRGLQSYGPENSFASFNAAAERKMWAIETDFRITADGHVVCIHDKTLDRTTDGNGLVSEKTLDEIWQLKVKPVNTKTVKPKYDYSLMSDAEKRVPSMDEYLEICKKNGCVAFVELKEDNGIIGKMIEAIRRHGMEGSCVISSGKLELLERYREAGGKETIHLIFAKPEQISRIRDLGNASVSFKYTDLNSDLNLDFDGTKVSSFEELVEYMHSLGVRVCFRAADTPETAKRHISLGVDYMPTNELDSM